MRTPNKIDIVVRKTIGVDETLTDKEVLKLIRDKKKFACKPCWELKYCPYGPVVEEFPLLPPTLDHALAHNEYLKECLRTRVLGSGEPLDDEKEKYFNEYLSSFEPTKYPTEIHPEIEEMGCNVFGHICPVFFVAEPFTETEKERRRGRYIPFELKMRVVRRDNYTCQQCGKHLKDNEVEFDHIIPVAKGGSTEEHNIRLTCYDCNREKTDKIYL